MYTFEGKVILCVYVQCNQLDKSYLLACIKAVKTTFISVAWILEMDDRVVINILAHFHCTLKLPYRVIRLISRQRNREMPPPYPGQSNQSLSAHILLYDLSQIYTQRDITNPHCLKKLMFSQLCVIVLIRESCPQNEFK